MNFNRKGRFGFIPITFILIMFMTALLNVANIINKQPIAASEYTISWVVGMLILAVILEFVYLFLDKFLGGIFG